MEDEGKSKEQLIQELTEARKRIAELGQRAAECRLKEEALCKSDEMLGATLAMARMAYWDWNLKTGRKIASDSASNVYGLLPGEPLGRSLHVFRLIHPADLKHYRELVQHVVEKWESWHKEFRIIRPRDKRIAWLEELATAKRDPVTGEMHIIGLVWDITERKLTEQALQESEARYRILAENAHDVIWAMDMDFRFTYVSPSSIKMFGYTPEVIMGQPFASAYTDESRERIMDYLSEAIVWSKEGHVPEEKRSIIVEAERYRKDGSTLWVEVTTNVHLDKEGKPVGIVGVTRDISERKQVEEELRKHREHLEEIVKERTLELDIRNVQLEKEVAERKRAEVSLRDSEALYRLLATNARDIIFTMDMDLRFTYISPSVLRIRGFTVEEAMAQTLSEALTPTSLEAAMRFLKENAAIVAKDVTRISTIELEETCKDGSTIWTESAFSPLLDEEKKLTGILGITRDVSERKRAEEEKKKLENQLLHVQKIEALDRFAGGIAHDLNNILSPIIMNIEGLLLDEVPSSTRHEILDETLRAAYRQKDLVRKILTFGRRSEQVFKPIRIKPLLEESIAFLRSTLPSTIEIQQYINVQSDMILGDPIQIHQVILNLCQNGADALDEKKGTIEIRLTNVCLKSLRGRPDIQAGEYLELTVKDNGMGMDHSVKERIFDPFFTTKGVGKGTGMGLSIAHGIVKSHGGAITMKSQAGKGSLFKVYLPLSEAVSQVQAFHDDHEPSAPAKRKVLLVDDEQLILSSLQRTLNMAGYQVNSLSSSMEAFSLFSQKPYDFDLVVTDLTMPGMTGVELSRKLRNVRPDIPIILCTGFNDAISQDEASLHGIRLLLQKPVGIGELKKAISQVLEN